MKTIYFTIASVALLLLSCTRDNQFSADEQIIEGMPVTIDLNIMQEVASRSGMSKTQEQKINNAFVLVFDKSGHKVSHNYYSSNVSSTISGIQTQSGSNMSIYVVANLTMENTGHNPYIYFSDVNTVAELNQKMVSNLAGDLSANRSLVMYGSLTSVSIPATGTKQVTVQLNYAVAKVTLYVVTALTTPTDAYNLTDWTVTNYPLKSYLFPQPTDAANPTVDSDFANSVTTISWVDTTIMVNNVRTPAKYAFLYMFENRRGTNSNTTELQKALNVPAKSTAMVINGYYKTTASNKVQGITTTVYLGNNNYNDYNVNRGKEYSYVATIKGINNVNVSDSRVVTNTNGYQVNLFSPAMDNHPDRRPIQINSWPGKSIITIYNTGGSTPCTWLHLSTIDLNKAVNNARPTYNPATDMVNSLTLTFPTTTPATMTSQMAYLYADENTSTSPRTAYLVVQSIEGLTNSQEITIQVSQKGYQTMGNVGFRSFTTSGAINPADDYIMVVENIEEATLNLTPGAVAGTEATTNMQWGFNLTVAEPTASAVSDYYYRNGYPNTLWLVMSNTTGGLGSTLRPPYGRLSAANASSASVTITENAMDPIFNTYPARYCFEKNRDLDGDGQITNPNTKGVDEISWYLPSAEELYAMYVGQYALPNYLTGANYQVSSEVYGSNNATNSMSYGTGISGSIGKSSAVSVRCVKKLYLTQPQATQNSPYVEASSRIINNTGYASTILRASNVARPVPMNSQNSTINNQLSPRFQVAKVDCLLNGASGASTMTWAQANGWTTVSDASSSTGIVASPATGCQAYSEPGAAAGTWRLPTQREMYIILFMRKELVAGQDGYTNMAGGRYWAASNLGATLGWYGIIGNTTVGFGGKTSLFATRCIRDL